MNCSDCGGKKDECSCGGRSRSQERRKVQRPSGTAPSGTVGSLQLSELAAALRPMLQEVVRLELTDRVKDLEAKVDAADDAVQGLTVMDSRVAKLETEVEELKRRMAEMESQMSSRASSSSNNMNGKMTGFTPSYIEIKGFCGWEERRVKGLSCSQASTIFEKLKTSLPQELQDHFGPLVTTGMFCNKLRIKTSISHTMDIKASLSDAFVTKTFQINDTVPYVVAERSPEMQQKFAVYGKVVDIVKKASVGKEGHDVVDGPRYCAVFVQIAGQERPKFIA